MQVTLGLPYYDSFTPETLYSLLASIPSLPHDLHLSMVGGPLVDQNREKIVDEALEAKSDRLLFIDSDIAFPEGALTRILAHEYPIIGGMYHLKRFPLTNAMKLESPDSMGEYFTGRITLPDHPIQCALLPAGFLSLHLPTLVEKLPRPWFPVDHRDGEIVGEDVAFCRHARAHGLELFCDPTIMLKHMGRHAF